MTPKAAAAVNFSNPRFHSNCHLVNQNGLHNKPSGEEDPNDIPEVEVLIRGTRTCSFGGDGMIRAGRIPLPLPLRTILTLSVPFAERCR